MEEGELILVSFKNLDYGREEHDIELRAGLHTGGSWEYEVSFYVFGLGEVGGHEVGVAEASIALNEEQVECLLS